MQPSSKCVELSAPDQSKWIAVGFFIVSQMNHTYHLEYEKVDFTGRRKLARLLAEVMMAGAALLYHTLPIILCHILHLALKKLRALKDCISWCTLEGKSRVDNNGYLRRRIFPLLTLTYGHVVLLERK